MAIRYHAEHQRAYFRRLKELVISHYSHGECKCSRCGYNDIRALSLDHIEGDGAEHRRQGNGSGSALYKWAKKNGFPSGLQVLCMNCQFIKRYENQEFGDGGASRAADATGRP